VALPRSGPAYYVGFDGARAVPDGLLKTHWLDRRFFFMAVSWGRDRRIQKSPIAGASLQHALNVVEAFNGCLSRWPLARGACLIR